jgi:O-antigen/teichoic acid export membrane protein
VIDTAGSARRAVWGFLDQGISSLINFAVGFLIARTVTSDLFGAFSVAFSIYLAFLVSGRAFASEPFLIRHSHSQLRYWRVSVAAATGVGLIVGVIGTVAMVVIGLIVGGTVGSAMVPMAFALPGLILLDTMRFALIARGRPEGAFLCDIAWLVILVPGLFALEQLGQASLELPILVWGGSALVVVAIAHLATGTGPSPRMAVGWWRRHGDIAPRYVAEALISLTASQLTIIVVGVLAGLSAAGGLRGAQLLLGPMQVLFIGIGSISVPEGVAILRAKGPRGLVRPAIALSIVVAASVLVYGLVLLQIPDSLGTSLLGETWAQARPLIGPLSLAYAGVTSALGAAIGLRVLADARTSLRARIVDATAQTGGGIGGAWAFGAIGAAFGLALGSWIGAAAAWVSFRSSVRHASMAPMGTEGDDAVPAVSDGRIQIPTPWPTVPGTGTEIPDPDPPRG